MSIPYAFTGPYANCYANRVVCMDERHVYAIHEILCGWPFDSALEIGSFDGASGTAFIEAINAESLASVVFCDVNPRPSLRAVAESCQYLSAWRITNRPSVAVLQSDIHFDCILVDGNHDLASVKPEVDELVRRQPLCIIAHDTNATAADYPHAEGAAYLKQVFAAHPEYLCIEDCQERPGEETHRGLFVAVRDADLFGVVRKAFAKWTAAELAVAV